MKCDKYDKCTMTDCSMCVDRGADMNEIRWTDKVYLDSQGNIRSFDGCPTADISEVTDYSAYPVSEPEENKE